MKFLARILHTRVIDVHSSDVRSAGNRLRGRIKLRDLLLGRCWSGSMRKCTVVAGLAAISIVAGCGENPYEPAEMSAEEFFATPSISTSAQPARSPATPSQPSQDQLDVRSVVTISNGQGASFWEFREANKGPLLDRLPAVASAGELYLRDDQPAEAFPHPTNAPPIDNADESGVTPTPITPGYTVLAPLPAATPLQLLAAKEVSLRDVQLKSSNDSNVAVMLLPPLPVEVVQPEPAATSPVQQDDRPWAIDDEEIAEIFGAEDEVFDASERFAPDEREPESFSSSPLTEVDEISSLEESLPPITPAPTAVSTGVLTSTKINQQAITKIRRGYRLAGRGAFYAARAEFVGVLRMISQAKDAKHGRPRRTLALAAGLRAIEEAADYAPKGVALDANVNVKVIATAHRTPAAMNLVSRELLPQQMIDRYLRYAQYQLGGSVAGEPAGSMALHALGKLNSQLGKLEAEQNPLAHRTAYAFQQASLMAHNENHLAAHELGVLMAESGHFAESHDLLAQVATRQPHPTILHNLARVQGELGNTTLAATTRDHARQLEQQTGVTRGIAWVSPQSFSKLGQTPRLGTTAPPSVAQRPQPRLPNTMPATRMYR